MTSFQVAIQLFLQLTIILLTCRAVGWLGRRFLGQTQVVMEMVAGILLGPSLLGLVAPALQVRLFPTTLVLPGGASVAHPNMAVLYALAQLGLVLYMFLVGLEFDRGLLLGRARSALSVSLAGILVPFALAALLVPRLLAQSGLFAPQATYGVALLFVGSGMSITAFPMLARILYERGIAATTLGTLTLAAGAIDDAIAWCLLALVLAVFRDTPETAVLAVLGGLAFGLILLTVGRRLLARLGQRFEASNAMGRDLYTVVLSVLLLCALLADAIGIHAVFGAFACGVAMPRGRFAAALTSRMEMLTTTLLVPVFFVYSGLNTRLGLVEGRELWWLTGLVIACAIAGKGVACMLAARASGEDWQRSSIIGTLMNARGLMELILLNIGLERGVITTTFFTMMVLMAVVTTLMASPLYRLLSRNLVLAGVPR